MEMGRNKYFRNKTRKPFSVVLRTKNIIEKTFDCYRCSIHQGILVCKGALQPTTESEEYSIKIRYDGKRAPSVHIMNPQIQYNENIHMYSDKSLCLYYPKEQPWRVEMNLVKTIIPWVSEWLVYYELYKYCGKWLGPEANHGSSAKIKNGEE